MYEHDRVRRMGHGGSDGGSDRRVEIYINNEMVVK